MNLIDLNTAKFSLDSNKVESLAKMSKFNKTDDDTKLKQAAKDFEAVFIKKMFDIMESTVKKSELVNGGHGESIFKSMMYDHIAKDVASSPHSSFGLAEQIYQQMKDLV
ncbi:MAG: rod-binding protein [Ignavibacteriales bacterium]|nr:rod-binding protein [Ignavibacteriales bacterium]